MVSEEWSAVQDFVYACLNGHAMRPLDYKFPEPVAQALASFKADAARQKNVVLAIARPGQLKGISASAGLAKVVFEHRSAKVEHAHSIVHALDVLVCAFHWFPGGYSWQWQSNKQNRQIFAEDELKERK